MTQTRLLNDGWTFAKSGLEVMDQAQLTFVPVDLPHDWLIYDTTNLYETSIGWYRRYLDCTKAAHVFLYFEGVYMDCSLYVNDTWIGDHKNGYTSFEFEITEALREGTNEILVKVVHQAPNSRWYSGAGIYRDVWLKTREKDYLVTDGIYVSTKKTGEVEVASEVVLGSGKPVHLTQIISRDGDVLARSSCCLDPQATTQAGVQINRQSLKLDHVELWSPKSPSLYQLVTLLEGDQGEPLDSVTQQIGFRDIVFHPDAGLRVNGQPLKLQGVCEHHDLGALGSAFNRHALAQRLKLLREMGVNAIRTAHNVPAKALMELADELGFFVISEVFDMWERAKNPYDYARFFPAWAPGDVARWVRRDRNHPSLLMWSIGNEVFDTHLGERGVELTQLLVDLVRKDDPNSNGVTTFGSNYLPWEKTRRCAELLDVVGYNYGAKFYGEHHQEYSHWVIYGSETCAVVQSRGIYHFPLEKPILADDDQQCSALGNSPVSWGAASAEDCLEVEQTTPFSLGQFIWTGFDYLGEPTPYHTKNSYFGQLDTAMFPKDSYYIFQAAWTDYKEEPMIHLFPYWDFNLGQKIDVRIASNAPLVSLELNGKEIGRRDLRSPKYLYTASWQLPYEPGELRALAYNEAGEVIASCTRRSFGDAARIRLQASQNSIFASGKDLVFLQISMEDQGGNPVENATNRVHVKVSGAGRLVGLDNGDSTDYDGYKGMSRRLFSGKLLAIIASTLTPGTIKVEVSSPGLPTEVATYLALPPQGTCLEGVSAEMENAAGPCLTGQLGEIPLRKIELLAPEERLLTPERPEVEVQAKLHPENTSYQDLIWRVVTAGGIESKLATVVGEGDRVRLQARGDGHFRLRCLSKNGTDQVRLFSELEFEIRGLGKLYKDPYDFVSAGLYDDKVGEVTSGNERGVATARGQETQVGFAELDFGSDSSDTITIDFFALTSDPYRLQIWQGKPGDKGSILLADTVYQKESKWNVYQAATYHLAKELTGICNLWFVTWDKMHIKGFSCSRKSRARQRILAADHEQIYGDHYVVRDTRVEEIGNNVTLDFGELDFGPNGVDQVRICGRTPLEGTMLLLSLQTDQGEIRRELEFVGSSAYREEVFALEPVQGKVRVRFIFLPGSQFDFSWFQFQDRKEACK